MAANPETPSQENDKAYQKLQWWSFLDLGLIIVAIIAGVLVGWLFGRQMWLASDGPTTLITKREATIEQKREYIAEAEAEATAAAEAGDEAKAEEKRAEAQRLEGHIPLIEEDIAQLREAQATAAAEKEAGSTSFKVAGILAISTEFLGDMFIRILKMIVVPLVITSMICGITGLGDIRKLGKLGGFTVLYYMMTTAIAVVIGIVLVQTIQPGVGADDTFAYVEENVEAKKDSNVVETLLDVFRGQGGDKAKGMFPENLFLAAGDTNVLGLIVFSLLFGGALTTLGERGRPAIAFFDAANEAVLKIVHLAMYFAPIGIFGLVAWQIAKNGGGTAFLDQVKALFWYVMTVIFGLSSHAVMLCLLLLVLGRRNPITYLINMMRALLTAMSTASSSATLPVTMECVEENNRVSGRSAGFVLPLGATINMDGTALYEAVAVIFIAQLLGIPMSFATLVIIFLTATLAAIGAAGIPSAGLVTMVIVLQAAGIPMTGIGAILAIDWFLDRLRTTLNVFGDSVGAAVVEQVVVSKMAPATE